MSRVTTHVLDTARGLPASGMAVTIEVHDQARGWTELARGITDADGRITNLLDDATKLNPGIYRLRFATGDYFQSQGVQAFYPEVLVTVYLADTAGHYHIPLLLSPYGYSTYRGR